MILSIYNHRKKCYTEEKSKNPSSQDICVDFQAQFLRRQDKNAQAYLCMASTFNAVMRKNLLERRAHTLVKTGSKITVVKQNDSNRRTKETLIKSSHYAANMV